MKDEKGGTRLKVEGDAESAPLHPSAVVEVAAAVIIRLDGSFLLAERPPGKVYSGYWEFPGGKIEAGEAPRQGLARELHEELGIDVARAYPWLTQTFTYPHAGVRLNFFRVTYWHGDPHGRESQRIAWCSPQDPPLEPMLPANTSIFRALRLPPVYAVSNASELGVQQFLARLDNALDNGLKLVQVREKEMAPEDLVRFAREVVERCHAHGARVLINADIELAYTVGADGVHLTSAQLRHSDALPAFDLVGASCHNANELRLAAALGTDFAVLGPVKPTRSHPQATLLGMQELARLLAGYGLPTYAIGGLSREDMESVWMCGAHGVAMQRAAW